MEYFSYRVQDERGWRCTAFDDSDTLASSIATLIKKHGSIDIRIRFSTDEEIAENEEVRI